MIHDLDDHDIQSIVSHPVHIKDEHGHISPSSFIPFCSIGSNMSLLGENIEQFSHPVCTAFKPKMLEGQMCYQLDLEEIQKQVSFKKGDNNGLIFLMDYNEDKAINEQFKKEYEATLLPNDEAIIFVDTLGKSHD